MYEFEAVSVSSYEAGSLAAKLTEKSADGWEVAGIVTAGSDVTAFLKRATGVASSTSIGATSATSATAAPTDAAGTSSWGTGATDATSTSGPSDPAGWGSAPASGGSDGASSTSWGTGAATDTGSTGGWGSTGGGSTDTAGSGWGSSTAGTAASQPAQSTGSVPATPPGWYADPAGRYELRYWDGSSWTEHVSRAGQQYTDPPVA
ncbi:MAG: DUF2510 domain-containing protein [Desertimonas sp.]